MVVFLGFLFSVNLEYRSYQLYFIAKINETRVFSLTFTAFAEYCCVVLIGYYFMYISHLKGRASTYTTTVLPFLYRFTTISVTLSVDGFSVTPRVSFIYKIFNNGGQNVLFICCQSILIFILRKFEFLVELISLVIG